jgi:hypothetical protein
MIKVKNIYLKMDYGKEKLVLNCYFAPAGCKKSNLGYSNPIPSGLQLGVLVWSY